MTTPKQVHGILLLDKPIDMTSNRALQRAKRLFQAKKAGHTGSLDPLATGMLPLCFGEATKFSQYLLDSNKTYHVVAQLGVQTNTGDCEGEVIATAPLVNITEDRVQAVLKSFLGEQDQVPPMFSALKFQGKPLYELARKGIEIERKARRVTMFSIDFEKLAHDKLSFTVHCSKGTYVRTLVEDIGRALGCGAHVAALRRTVVTPYEQAPMYTLEQLEDILATGGAQALEACLLPVDSAVNVLPVVILPMTSTFYMRMGQAVRATFPSDSSFVRLVSEDGVFIGLGEALADGRIKPHRLLAAMDVKVAV